MSITGDFYLPLKKKEKVAKDTYSFYFDRVKRGFASKQFDFLPGQYVRMTLDIKNPDDRGTSRSFTIASSTLDNDHIMITTRIIKSSFKKRMVELVPGEKVKFFGPIGGFFLDEKDKDSRVFLAGGIGITPFHSMIIYAFTKKLTIPLTLIVSFSRVEDMFFYDELSNISKENPLIKIVYVITHPDEKWKGETGRISGDLIKKYVPNILDPKYFIVGPSAMVAAMEEVVKNMGAPNEKIFIENFTGY